MRRKAMMHNRTAGVGQRHYLLGFAALLAVGYVLLASQLSASPPSALERPLPAVVDGERGCPAPDKLLPSPRDHVHLFFVGGLDPIDFAGLKTLQAYCESLGFRNTYWLEWYEGRRLEEEVPGIRSHDPEARFVFVGYSLGANVIRTMARSLGETDGIEIDLLVYISGNLLKYGCQSTPPNVAKVIHIMADGCVYRETPTVGAENYQLKNTLHFNTPPHPQTLCIVGRELPLVAARGRAP
jgi:hypothetical protein